MVGMGSVVTHDVAPFHLVVGNPARAIAIVCRCGEPVWRFPHRCQNCGLELLASDVADASAQADRLAPA